MICMYITLLRVLSTATLCVRFLVWCCCVWCCVQDAYDWGSCQAIMDVGGGRGELLSTVLSWAGPDCKGLLLDVQMVIDR